MRSSALRSRVQLQVKVETMTAMGATVVWTFVQYLYCRRIAMSARAIAAFQQMSTEVSDKFIFRGEVDINLDKHRILHGSKTYEPKSPAKQYEGVTEVVCLEI